MNATLADIRKSSKPRPSTKTKLIHFSVHGDFITDKIRDFCLEGNPIHAWKVFSTLTTDIEIFKSIIKGEKGFSGVDTFRLKKSKRVGITGDVLNVIRWAKQEEFKEDMFSRALASDAGEDEGCDGNDFNPDSYNKKVRESEKTRMAQLTFFAEKMGLSFTQIEDMYLKTLSSETYTHPHGGWITEKGYFIPVDFCQHDNYLYKLFDEGYVFEREVANIERRWARVSTDLEMIKAMNLHIWEFNPTAKQKITIEKILKARNVLKEEGDSIPVQGYGMVYLESGQIKFSKDQNRK